LDEEERTVEITIHLDKPLVFVILLFIIILQSGYIGYLTFFPEREASESASEDDEINFDLEEPETFEELREDLLAVGCQHVVNLYVDDMRGKHLEVSYPDALKLAREAGFVGVNESIMGFIMYLDGEYYIWFTG
jgi:hypothetical protein